MSDKNDQKTQALSTDKVRQLSEELLAGKQWSIESAIMQNKIFDSINSPVATSRNYYIGVSMFLLKRGDAIFSPVLSKNICKLLFTNPDDFIPKMKGYNDQLIIDLGITLNYYLSKKEVKEKGVAASVRRVFLVNLNGEDSLTKKKIQLVLKYI